MTKNCKVRCGECPRCGRTIMMPREGETCNGRFRNGRRTKHDPQELREVWLPLVDRPMSQRQEILKRQIESLGELPAYAWPGGYPVVYYPADNPSEELCQECAESERRKALEEDDEFYRLPEWDTLEGTEEDHGIVVCYNCGNDILNS